MKKTTLYQKTTIKNEDSAVFNATVTNVDTTLGVYNINKSIYRLKYNSATNANIAFTPYVYQYNDANKVKTTKLISQKAPKNLGASLFLRQ